MVGFCICLQLKECCHFSIPQVGSTVQNLRKSTLMIWGNLKMTWTPKSMTSSGSKAIEHVGQRWNCFQESLQIKPLSRLWWEFWKQNGACSKGALQTKLFLNGSKDTYLWEISLRHSGSSLIVLKNQIFWHKDASDARATRGKEALVKINKCFHQYDPFCEDTEKLVNIANGMCGDGNVNCHESFEIGLEIMRKISGK